jgi:hypothetical protein
VDFLQYLRWISCNSGKIIFFRENSAKNMRVEQIFRLTYGIEKAGDVLLFVFPTFLLRPSVWRTFFSSSAPWPACSARTERGITGGNHGRIISEYVSFCFLFCASEQWFEHLSSTQPKSPIFFGA